MIALLYTLSAILCLVGFAVAKGGLSNIARSRKYKSGTIWCAWRWTDVRSEYILRLHLVKTPWFAVCLHWIRKPDPEPHLHDHPVSFLSLILRGGYAEVRQKPGEESPQVVMHRWYNFISADGHDRHRIILARARTLTLCFMGPKTREWGYHHVRCPGDWMGWKAYEAYIKASKDAFGDGKEAFYNLWKKLDEEIDLMAAAYEKKWKAVFFLDEEVRRISTIAGDFDDEAPTEPRK